MGVDDEIVWVTKDGRQLTLAQIDDRHLENIIHMLQRSADAAFACGFQGEQASYEADRHFDRCSEQALEFQFELDRRKGT
jgi:molybdopterin-guanine dinucleotide biosynthesis protein